MCGRFDLDLSNKDIDRLVSQLPKDGLPLKRGEIFPGNNALTLVLREGKPAPEAMAWGFPRWDGKGLIFNARAESALLKPMFKNSLLNFPAVIPASGFYEWRAEAKAPRKTKFRFTNPDNELLYLAGFWNTFPGEEIPHHFNIITACANPSMEAYHSRMPLILRKHEIEDWLNGNAREEILGRQPEAVKAELCV